MSRRGLPRHSWLSRQIESLQRSLKSQAEAFASVEGNLVRLGIPNPGKYAVDVRYDRNGFRNDREYERAEIAMVGDSFVEGYQVDEDVLFEAIERCLNPTN